MFDGTVNVYQSEDATDVRLLKSSAYTPPSNRIRDASVLKHTHGFHYLTYTTHTWQDVRTTIGFARGSDRADRTFLYDCTVPIADLPRAWAPEWFVDSDGSVHVIVSCWLTSNEWIFAPYRLRAANSALTDWSSPVAQTRRRSTPSTRRRPPPTATATAPTTAATATTPSPPGRPRRHYR